MPSRATDSNASCRHEERRQYTTSRHHAVTRSDNNTGLIMPSRGCRPAVAETAAYCIYCTEVPRGICCGHGRLRADTHYKSNWCASESNGVQRSSRVGTSSESNGARGWEQGQAATSPKELEGGNKTKTQRVQRSSRVGTRTSCNESKGARG
jgi:hypothetical protein